MLWWHQTTESTTLVSSDFFVHDEIPSVFQGFFLHCVENFVERANNLNRKLGGFVSAFVQMLFTICYNTHISDTCKMIWISRNNRCYHVQVGRSRFLNYMCCAISLLLPTKWNAIVFCSFFHINFKVVQISLLFGIHQMQFKSEIYGNADVKEFFSLVFFFFFVWCFAKPNCFVFVHSHFLFRTKKNFSKKKPSLNFGEFERSHVNWMEQSLNARFCCCCCLHFSLYIPF